MTDEEIRAATRLLTTLERARPAESFGGTYTDSWPACPDGYAPIQSGDTEFGDYWYSTLGRRSEGVDAVDLTYSPPSAQDNPILWVAMSWRT